MKFVVTGCARSGTKYTATVLTLSGILTGHEGVINSWKPDTWTIKDDWKTSTYDGDVSFLAAPHVKYLSSAGLTVVHLVRPPLQVVSSIVNNQWTFDLRAPYMQYIAHHIPELMETPPGPQRAALYWLRWNTLAAQNYDFLWDTTNITSENIHELADATGVTVTKKAVKKAVDRVPRNVHQWNPRHLLPWESLGHLADEVAAAAHEYGVALS